MLVQDRAVPKHGPPTYQIIKVTNANHMSVMKTSLMIIPMCPREFFYLYKSCPGLSFTTKRIGPPCCTLFTLVTCYPLQITLLPNYLLLIISVLAVNTLLKTACHFLLLLIGFDTLTYRKDYNRYLHIWVIKTLFWRRCRGVKRLW